MGENDHWQFSSFLSNLCIPYYRNMDIPYSEIFENESMNLFLKIQILETVKNRICDISVMFITVHCKTSTCICHICVSDRTGHNLV